ncbi:hypothetical protein LTR13_000887 [Exophiala sideris]|nr:hypothetical protein LTR13_000887 [Exophiala sideris]
MDDYSEEIRKLYGPWQVLFTEENILDYRPGGYHPVALGDMSKDDRYKILHKLAHDENPTRWVAWDGQLEQWVSIKILKADRTSQSRELQHHRALSKLAQGHLLSKHIVRLFDDFILDGPNGRHLCLVFELLAPPVDWMVTRPHISVKTLTYTSDMLSWLDEKELLKVLGAPVVHNVKREDGEPLGEGIPRQIIMAAEWDDYPHDDDDEDDEFLLFDLGGAFTRDTKPEKLAGHECLQAPETLFTSSFDHRADLWSAGLTIYYLASRLFPLRRCWRHIEHKDPVETMIEFAGELPQEWQQKHEQLRNDAERDFSGRSQGERKPPGSALEEKFPLYVPEPELQVLLPIIKGLTKLNPSNRMSAGQALFLIGMPHEECYATDEGRDVKWY